MVTQEQAEAVLAAVIARYEGYWGEMAVEDGFDMPRPTLVMASDLTDGHPVIIWEEGPYEWAINHTGGVNQETFNNLYPEFVADAAQARTMATVGAIEAPDGLFLEPVNSWALGIYEA